jgi:hypothetical protein
MKGRSKDELRELHDNASWEDSELSDQIELLQIEDLVTRARRYLVPVPAREMRQMGSHGDYLKREDFAKLRSAIREEQSAQREQLLAWIP